MTRLLRALCLGLALLSAARGFAKESVDLELDRAVKLFDDFEDKKAAVVLADVLKRAPSPDQLAKAHVYLGLIALNALKTEKARAEFKLALAIDATTELPFDASPKARLTYDQARREVEREAQQETPKAPQPKQTIVVQQQGAKPPPAVVVVGPDQGASPTSGPETAPPEPKTKIVHISGVDDSHPVTTGPSYAPAIVVAALGAGALIGAAVVGSISTSTLSQANDASDVGQAQQLASQAGTQGLVADILFGVGGAGLAVGIILFVVEANSGSGSNVPVHADANGLSIAF